MTKTAVLSELKDADFQPLINSEFTTTENGAKTQSFELLEVTPLGSKPDNNERHAFSLVFRGENIQTPQQSIYELEHPKLGQLALFLVPIGSDQHGMRYEAVFT